MDPLSFLPDQITEYHDKQNARSVWDITIHEIVVKCTGDASTIKNEY